MNSDSSIPELSDSELNPDESDEGKNSSEIMSPQMKNLIESSKRFNDSLAQEKLKKAVRDLTIRKED